MGYHDPKEFWQSYHRAKTAMVTINRLPAPARRRTRAALVRRLTVCLSDLSDRLGEPTEKGLVEDAYFAFQKAARRCSGDTKDAKTDQEMLERLLSDFLGSFRARQLRRRSNSSGAAAS